MTKVPSVPYFKIVAALQRLGFVVVRQKGSHLRLQKHSPDGEIIKITVPAHTPVLRSTLSHILKQARVEVEDFLTAL